MNRILVGLFLILNSSAGIAESGSWKSWFGGAKSIYGDFGFSSNVLLSDESFANNGIGIGHQFSTGMAFNLDEDIGFKLRIQSAKHRQEAFTNRNVVGSNQNYRAFEQEWDLLGFGLEFRRSNRLIDWYWESLLGYAFGKKSRIVTQENDVSAGFINNEELTRSFFYLGLGAGIRYTLKKKWNLILNLNSNYILGSVYGDELQSTTIILIPLMASGGLEYRF
ncbi:MAG: hypothetical protein AB8E15_08660 [Bdellovibrionales bacterium]